MTVKITGMEMPKSCGKCKFCVLKDFCPNEHTHKFRTICFLTKDELSDSLRERYTNCPLQAERSESMSYCKDCEYFFKREGHTYCSALPVVEEIYRCFGCIYFKYKKED